MRVCETCGGPIRRKQRHSDAEYASRRFCSSECVRHPSTPKYLDLLDLVALGEAPLAAADRLGINPGNAARWMYRHGHPDLARHFHRKAP